MIPGKDDTKNKDNGQPAASYGEAYGEPVIAIFDIGKTNKKIFLIDRNYKILHEDCVQLIEVTDEDGFAGEDVHTLTKWVQGAFQEVRAQKDFDLKAINFSTYGASLVHVDTEGKAIAPLYNYLKPFPETLKKQFYDTYGGETAFSQTTASPVLGNLNSGLQLYRLKYEQPGLFEKIYRSLHLPQYISSLFTGTFCSDITSIGCHTGLWDFTKSNYHQWVYDEDIVSKLADIFPSGEIAGTNLQNLPSGVGLHDSSAALIPYLACFEEPFVLISTGTWCISMNPFNAANLTRDELEQDCLCYLTYQGQPVKASRLFAGYWHEQQINKLAAHYNKAVVFYKTIEYDPDIIEGLSDEEPGSDFFPGKLIKKDVLAGGELGKYATYADAYHQLMLEIMVQQKQSTDLILQGETVKRIFVDGGFSKNPLYMHLLAKAYPNREIYSASVAQASALGAALAVHKQWNDKPLPLDIIELKKYNPAKGIET